MERLTEREQEILNILKQEPMIAQEELAARLKITRSAAAVHISNLIKKGFVLGRGYVFNEKTGVVLIGNTYLAIKGFPHGKLQWGSVNSGKITLVAGGGVCSIAQHLAQLNVPTMLISALGRDTSGDQLVQALNKAGVNTNHLLRSKKYETGKLFAMITEDGKLDFALADHGINNLLGVEFISQKEHILANCQYLVVDDGLSKAVIEAIVKVASLKDIPLAVLPVAYGGLEAIRDYLDKVNLLVLNREQLALLTGARFTDPEQALQAGKALTGQGLQVLVTTFGEQGVALVTEQEALYLPNPPTQVIDTDAAADAILAGFLYGLLKGFPNRQAVRMGLRVAAMALSRQTAGEGLEEEELAGLYQEA